MSRVTAEGWRGHWTRSIDSCPEFPFPPFRCASLSSLSLFPFPRLLFLSPPSSAPVTGGVSLRQLLAVFAERSLPLASFSLGYTEFHARCRLPSLARQIAREQTPASGVLVTTYEQPETGVKRLRELDDIWSPKDTNIFGSANSVKSNLIVTNRFYSTFYLNRFCLLLEQILRTDKIESVFL